MSSLLMDDHPVVVSPRLAVVLGLEAAVFMQQVHYWVRKNKGAPVYNTIAQWHEQLPFMSVRSIERMIKSLKEKEVLLVTLVANSGNSFVKTNYYNINYDALDLMCELHDHANACPETAKMADGDRQNGGTETAKMAELYITETTTETTRDGYSAGAEKPKTKKTGATPNKGSRIPEDWVLTKVLGEWAMNEKPSWSIDDVRKQAESFKDYWTARAGAAALKCDWDATWRSWVRKSNDMPANSVVPKSGGYVVNKSQAIEDANKRTLEEMKRKYGR